MNMGVKLDVELRTMGEETFAIIRFPERMKVLSSTMRNGGFTETDTVLMMQVEPGYDNRDPEGDMASKISQLGLGEETVGFMTAAVIRKAISTAEECYHGVHATAVVTAGVVNAVMAGDLLPESTVRKLTKPGTINTVVVVDVPLECEACANAIITATEAKSAAMFERGIRGTGTTSDAVAIVSPLGRGTKYAGTATDVGIAIARAVRQATSESIRRWSLVNPPMDLLSLLERKGATMEDLWAIAKELPGSETTGDLDDLRSSFVKEMEMIKEDVNVNSLVQAAIHIQGEGDRDNIRGVRPGEFRNDPATLVADKMLGAVLVEYLAGKEELPEYHRYVGRDPNATRRLGPFLKDVVLALVWGAKSRACDGHSGKAGSSPP